MNNKKIAAFAAATMLLGSLSVSAFAEPAAGNTEPAKTSYAYFIAEKSVLGQGLVVEPVKVEIKDGENGFDILKKCAEIEYDDSWGSPYITAFKDTDTGAEVPAIIKEACKDWGTRNKEGYLSAYDYTSSSGWNFFVNDTPSSVGVDSYNPQDNDVIRFSFTVYGLGADLGIDSSSMAEWGGAAPLVTPAAKAELTRLAADCEKKDSAEYKTAIDLLGNLTATQADVDAAAEALKNINNNTAVKFFLKASVKINSNTDTFPAQSFKISYKYKTANYQDITVKKCSGAETIFEKEIELENDWAVKYYEDGEITVSIKFIDSASDKDKEGWTVDERTYKVVGDPSTGKVTYIDADGKEFDSAEFICTYTAKEDNPSKDDNNKSDNETDKNDNKSDNETDKNDNKSDNETDKNDNKNSSDDNNAVIGQSSGNASPQTGVNAGFTSVAITAAVAGIAFVILKTKKNV